MPENILRLTVWSISEDMATLLLLKAVCHAIYTNYYNLKVLACVLLKFSSNVHCAKAILCDYCKYITYIRLCCYNLHDTLAKMFWNDPITHNNFRVKVEGNSF